MSITLDANLNRRKCALGSNVLQLLDFVFCVLCVPAYLWIAALSLDSEIALIVLLGATLMCCTTRLGSRVSCSTHIV